MATKKLFRLTAGHVVRMPAKQVFGLATKRVFDVLGDVFGLTAKQVF
jgi:hypothetical protein